MVLTEQLPIGRIVIRGAVVKHARIFNGKNGVFFFAKSQNGCQLPLRNEVFGIHPMLQSSSILKLMEAKWSEIAE